MPGTQLEFSKNFSRGGRIDREAAARANVMQIADIAGKRALAPQRDLKKIVAAHENATKSRLGGKLLKLQQQAKKAREAAKKTAKII